MTHNKCIFGSYRYHVVCLLDCLGGCHHDGSAIDGVESCNGSSCCRLGRNGVAASKFQHGGGATLVRRRESRRCWTSTGLAAGGSSTRTDDADVAVATKSMACSRQAEKDDGGDGLNQFHFIFGFSVFSTVPKI